ncbi:Peroxisomal membrane protein 2 [Acipenser ruthenus]|uniref:Peroxisomal membrane protein 2 n=1 Tax=Acipenser ruthenus TaxID=7906 RepID=A0A444UR61_ACIRT|nr:Peroxisomal membrane protein 2 [Acipenser ruthenus]
MKAVRCLPSGILSALGNLLSQGLRRRGKGSSLGKGLEWLGPARFAAYGLCVTGPVSHYFYQCLELLVPSSASHCVLKRLLLDRLIFAPAFLLVFFLAMNFLEGKSWAAFQNRVRTEYWSALKMNWKVWTPFQFININYVPVQFRVLFANLVALFWYAYLASVRK